MHLKDLLYPRKHLAEEHKKMKNNNRMARRRHHQQKQQPQQHVPKADHPTTPWIIRDNRKNMSLSLTSASFVSKSKSFMFVLIVLLVTQCIDIFPLTAAFTTPFFGITIVPTKQRVLPCSLQQQQRFNARLYDDNCRYKTNDFVSTSATTSLFVTTTNNRNDRNRNRWKKSKSNRGDYHNDNNTTISMSSSSVCTENDIQFIHDVLFELKIDPVTETPWGSIHPEGSTRTFNYILQQIVDRQHNNTRRNLAEEVLRYMIQQNRSAIRPNLLTLNLVLASYYNSIASSSTSSSRVGVTKDTIPSNPQQEERQINQNQSSFPSSSSAAADTAYALLQEWDTVLYPNQLTSQPSDRVSYNTVVSAYGKSGNYQRAKIVFNELRNKSKEDNAMKNYQPDIISYNCLLNSMAIVGQASSALELFNTMLYDPQIPNPTIHSYNEVLYSLSKWNHPYEAYILLLEWLSLVSASSTGTTSSNRKTKYFDSDRKDELITIRPNTYSYNIVLHALTQAIRQENLKRSKQDQQQRRQKQQPQSQQQPPVRGTQAKIPTKNCINKYIRKRDRRCINDEYNTDEAKRKNDASATTGSSNADASDFLDPDTLHRTIEELFHRIPHRDIITYTTFIAALCEIAKCYGKNSNSNNNSRKVVTIFDTIRTTLLEGIHNDPSIENSMIDASFVSNVLYSLAIMEDIQAAVFADEMIEAMIERYNNIRPTVQLYNALLYCWGKSSSSTSTWQSSVDVGQRVLTIINGMEQNPLLQPNTITYTNAMDALKSSSSSSSLVSSSSRSSFIEAAEAILTKMEQSNDCLPNVYTYTTMIQNYARSRLPHKAVKAYNIIQRMKAKSVQPNIISYNAVLNACEHTDPTFDPIVTDDALKVACIAFDEIRASKTIYPNHITYGTFLGSMASLLPSSVPARNEIINLVFKRCCYDGQVSGLVLKKLRISVETDEQYDAILDGIYRSDDGDDIILPSDWTRNVQNDFITKAREIS